MNPLLSAGAVLAAAILAAATSTPAHATPPAPSAPLHPVSTPRVAPAPAASARAPTYLVQMRNSLPETADAGSTLAAQRLATVLAERRLALTPAGTLGGRWLRVQAEAGQGAAGAAAAARLLAADARVAAVVAEPREQRLQSSTPTPSDARYAEQWWLQAVAAGNTGAAGFATAWARSTGASTASVVAVLDSGITSHPDLNSRLLPGYDFVSDAVYAGDGTGRDGDPLDPGDGISDAERAANAAAFKDCPGTAQSSWHGTTIAGQVAAVTNNVEGVAAAHWGAMVVPVRVAGKCGAAVSDIVDGLRWAAGLSVPGVPANPNPARVIVLGYGGVDTCDVNSTDTAIAATARLYVDTLAEVRRAGAIVVVAAGNLRRAVGRPASCTGAFAVTSVNRAGFKSIYANFGPEIALAAPGGDGDTQASCDAQLADSGIVSTGNLGLTSSGAAGYVAASGTSFAAPAVAATAALMLVVNPQLTVAQLEQGLRASARPHVQAPQLGDCALGSYPGRCACTTTTCGAGLLDADRALAYAASPTGWQAGSCAPTVLVSSALATCGTLQGHKAPGTLPTAQTGACQAATPPTTPTTPTTPTPPATPGTGTNSGGGGGGALGAGWLFGVALATWLLRRRDASSAMQRPMP